VGVLDLVPGLAGARRRLPASAAAADRGDDVAGERRRLDAELAVTIHDLAGLETDAVSVRTKEAADENVSRQLLEGAGLEMLERSHRDARGPRDLMERDVATLALEAKKLAEFALAIWAGLRPHGCQWKESFSSLFYFIDVLACKPFAMQLDRCWHGDGAPSRDRSTRTAS
jgi:hypothetical protein